MAAELDALGKALAEPQRPLVAIVAGSKVSTKLTILRALAAKVDVLIVGGGIANTFILAAGGKIGKSLAEPDLVGEAKAILDAVSRQGADSDRRGRARRSSPPTRHAELKAIEDVADDDLILDIGPQSVAALKTIIARAGTIVWNGPVGVFEFDAFAERHEGARRGDRRRRRRSRSPAAATRSRRSTSSASPTGSATSRPPAARSSSSSKARRCRRWRCSNPGRAAPENHRSGRMHDPNGACVVAEAQVPRIRFPPNRPEFWRNIVAHLSAHSWGISMPRATKIVATLGPPAASPPSCTRMIAAGVDVVRLNFSHGTADGPRRARPARARGRARSSGARSRIMADLQGPKIRVGKFADGKVDARAGPALRPRRRVRARRRRRASASTTRSCRSDVSPRRGPAARRRPDQARRRIGRGSAHHHARCVLGGVLSNNKGINRQGGGLTAPALTAKDMDDIKTAAMLKADYLAVSFPKNKEDMYMARQLLRAAGGAALLIAKIERAEAIARAARRSSTRPTASWSRAATSRSRSATRRFPGCRSA